MNIAYIIPEFITEKSYGGLATYYDNIARLLSDDGHKIVIFVLSNQTEDIEYHRSILIKRVSVDLGGADEGVPGSFIRQWSRCMNEAVRGFIDEGNRIDIVQYANYMALGLDRLEDIPTVIRVSSFRPLLRAAENEVFDPNVHYESVKIPDYLENISVMKADCIYGPSESTAKLISMETKRDIGIIESPFFPKDEIEECDEFPILKGKTYIISFGILKLIKGAKLIGDCIYDILDKHRDLYWVFAGSDFDWKDASGKTVKPSEYIKRSAGIYSDRVVFLGQIKHKQLFSAVKNSEFCVLPSRVDNLPNTCIEAMALGKVVIGTRGASFEQLIEDGVNGFLIERENPKALYSKVCDLLQLDDNRLEEIGTLAKARIDKMKPEAIKNQLISLYQKTIREFGIYSYVKNATYQDILKKHNTILMNQGIPLDSEYYLR